MNIIQRIKEKTPPKDRAVRDVAGTIGAVCGAVLATGIVVSPIGITLLTIGAVVFGGKAVYHAQKVLK